MTTHAGGARLRAGSVREVWWRELLVLLGLTGFAISQPLLSVLGGNPTVFTFHGVDGAALLVFALAVAFVPPLVLWALGLGVTAVDRRAGWALHLATVAVLTGMTGVQAVKAAGLEREVLVASVAVVAGAGLAWLYHRFEVVSTWLQFTAILPVIAIVLFATSSPSSDLLGGRTAVAAPEEERNDLAPVVVIVLDEFPTKSILAADGTVDPVRFPGLAAFAQDATWYRHYTSMAPSTQYALPAVLSGNPPGEELPLWTNYPDNLFSLLAPTHDLVAFETATALCGLDTCTEGPPGTTTHRRRLGALITTTADVLGERIWPSPSQGERLDTFEESIDVVSDVTDDASAAGSSAGSSAGSTPGMFSTERVTTRLGRVDDFKASLAPREHRPPLFYLHLMLPHSPWRLHPSGEVYDVVTASGSYPYTPSNDQGAWVAALTEQRHLLQAQYADAVVGDLLDELRSRKLYDDSLVIVMADHGVSFELDVPGRSLAEGTHENVGDLAYSPLFVKAPGQTEGVTDDSNLQAIDVVPTIADLLGIDVPFETAGALAGSDAIAARGDEKSFYDLTGRVGDKTLRGIVTYPDDLPTANDRWIGPIETGDDPMIGLYRAFGLDPFIGASFDSLLTSDHTGAASFRQVDRLEAPPNGETPLGLANGRVLAFTGEGAVIAAIDGTVVAASPLYERDGRANTFTLFFPPGMAGSGKIRVALVEGEEITELLLG